MKIRHILSGEFFSSQGIIRRLPVLFVLFLLAVVYISAGYNMQTLKQRENNLKQTYKGLHVSAVIFHQKMVKETTIENINMLIKKYNLEYLKIETRPVSPIEIKND